ncbi:MAG: hypothetical protein O3A47_04140 [Chloroflexi bacterium]|nr:hypothetical protein [Chloroflexota bacterium]
MATDNNIEKRVTRLEACMRMFGDMGSQSSRFEAEEVAKAAIDKSEPPMRGVDKAAIYAAVKAGRAKKERKGGLSLLVALTGILALSAGTVLAASNIVWRGVAGEGNDAIIELSADQEDDTTDQLDLYIDATSNAFHVAIGGTDVMTVSSAGTLITAARLSMGHTASFTTAGPTDNVDVAGVNVIFVDATAATVTIGGFANGIAGQILYITSLVTANSVVLEDAEAGGSQDIFLNTEGDETVATKGGGWILACNGTSWFEVDSAAP